MNVVQEKYTGRGASSRSFVKKIGEMILVGGATQMCFIFYFFRQAKSVPLCNVTVYKLPIRLPAKSALTWPVV